MKIRSLGCISIALVLLVACAPAVAPPSPTPTRKPIASTPTLLPPPLEVTPPLLPTPMVPEPPVGSASYAFDRSRGELVQFGGTIALHCSECDVTWILDDVTWTQRQPQVVPPGRVGAGFVYDQARGNSVLFGSPTQASHWINDTWVWDGQNWTEKHPALAPSPRTGVQLVYDPDHQLVVLFGGIAPDPNNPAATIKFNDTWLWDGENWRQAHPANSPPAPNGTPWAMAYDGKHHYLVLSEGMTTWTWDGTDWTQQHPEHFPEVPLYRVMGYDESGQQLVLAGSTQDHAAQTWIWDGSDWQPMQTHLQFNSGGQPFLFFHTGYRWLLLYVVYSDAGGVTGSALWIWKDYDWIKAY